MAGLSGGLGLVLGTALVIISSAALAADLPSRAAAIAAADAAAGLPLAAESTGPACAAPPRSGEKLAGDMKLAEEGHAIGFENGGGGDALVKLRHAGSGKLAASFLVRRMEAVTVEGVPDGTYLIQYAFGPALAPDCKSFTRIITARQLPEADQLLTEVIDDEDKTETRRMSVSYQLSVSETANVKPVTIDAATFNAE